MTTPDISITRHKKRATIIGESEIGKFWLYAQYGDDVITTEYLVALQLDINNLDNEIEEMKEDGLEVTIR